MKVHGAALLLIFSLSSPANGAELLVGDFTLLNGAPSASGGTVSFALKPNGAIAATLTSTTGGILGFGFDAPVTYYLGDFAFVPLDTDGYVDSYGTHLSGFSCGGIACGTTISFTIGAPGEFTSVDTAISGGLATTDFFLLNNAGQWGGNARATTSVPEPVTWALMLLGFAAIGGAMRRPVTARPPVSRQAAAFRPA